MNFWSFPGGALLRTWVGRGVFLAALCGLSPGGFARAQDLVLTEFMADADYGLPDEDGELQDWIELYNPHAFAVSLAGWHLTDDPTNLTRWRFPSGTVAPHGYVVVFASGKDRRDPAGSWHTNFRLEREGEYLALVRPDGITRVTEFSPQFPPQFAGASYGLAMREEQRVYVSENAVGRVRVPLDGFGAGDWTAVGFGDAAWTSVELPIGYERPGAGDNEPRAPVADVTRPGDVIQPTSHNSPGNEGVTLAIDDNPATKYLNFDKLNAGFTVTPTVGESIVVGLRVTSANDAPERDPVSFHLEGSNDGLQFTEIARGGLPDFPARFYTVEVRFENDRLFRHFRLRFPTVRNAAAAVAMQIAEVELLGTVGPPPPQFSDLVRTDVETMLFGRHSAIQVRLPFTLTASDPRDALFLQVRYDDGFAAYLNGTLVALANAAQPLTPHAEAAADRPRFEAVQAEVFALSDAAGPLPDGPNLLAFLALNERPDSPEFLLGATLLNTRVTVDEAGYLATPTPGAANGPVSPGRVAEPMPDLGRGFYSSPLDVVLSSATPGAQIWYTLDGRMPSPETGEAYTGPIRLERTGPLRAVAYWDGWIPSTVVTHTYLFVNEIARQTDQSAFSRGFPATWGSTAADYAMDPRMVGLRGQDQYGGVYTRTIQADLQALPSISLVMDLTDWFGPTGIYSNPENRGDAWERPVSFEIIDPSDPHGGLHVNAGLRIQGGAFRRFDLTKKKSFRVIFRKAYGPGRLVYPLFGPDAAESFNNLVLRANSNDAWPWGGSQALYVRDAFAMETARAMGIAAPHTRFMHLYLNGLYWGLYNPVERPDAAFSASYHGGNRDDWDARNQDGLVAGTPEAWNRMLEVLSEGMSDNAVYQRIQGRNPDGLPNPDYPNLLDVDNLIDYMILNIYIGNVDWPHRNYWVGRDRTGVQGFQFYPWDSETALGLSGLTVDRTGVDGAVARPYAAARANAEFRMRFADRAHRHFSEGGALYVHPSRPGWDPAHPDDNPAAARFVALAAGIASPMVAEAARWGDQMGSGPFTRNDHWARAHDSLLTEYFPRRAAIVLEQLRAAGLYPRTAAPTIHPQSGRLEAGTTVTLAAPQGTIYYTLDGSDPRQAGSAEVIFRQTLVTSATPKRVLVPTTTNGGSTLGEAWRSDQGAFDDSGWHQGVGGVGYDTEPTYAPFIGIDVRNELYTKGGSVYVRIPFQVDGTGMDKLNLMTLRVRVDDGFAAFLNGVPIASFNAPATLSWNSFATGLNPDEAAVQYRAFDASAHLPALRAGQNLLALHGLNISINSSDFLLDAELDVGEQRYVEGTSTARPYTEPIEVLDLTTLKARASLGTEWSALSEARFMVGYPHLVISELHYHPADSTPAELAAGFTNDDDFEFIELYNAGDGSLDWVGVRFVDGVAFDFASSNVTRLAPGQHLILVNHRAAFEFRYGTGLPIAGTYTGRLSNSGERIEIIDASGQSLVALTYGTRSPWPSSADGRGPSLTLADFVGDPNDAESWQASAEWGGTPGRSEWGQVLTIEWVRRDATGLTLGFMARPGKAYAVRERRDWQEEWMTRATLPAQSTVGLREIHVPWQPPETSAFFQMVELP